MEEKIISYLNENPNLFIEPKFINKLYLPELNKQEFNENINIWLTKYDKHRSEPTYQYSEKLNLEEKINYLMNLPQPIQRTPEWFELRQNHLTGTSISSIFDTQSSLNRLIYEKCKPIDMNKYKPSLSENSLTWGHKYEPLTGMLYEKYNNTKITDFGCIKHPLYDFLAASPDGIVTGENNYGRMIEIKNVVSRVIDGIPIKDYYIQMQIQMEVCDLNECDFIETKFTELENREEYENEKEKEKGIIIVFVKNCEQFMYEYMPLDTVNYEEWIDEVLSKYENDSTIEWFKYIYWRLDVYSCVLVKRRPEWFKYALDKIKNTWDIILKEKDSDEYLKRAPKKRNKKEINESNEMDELENSTGDNIPNVSKCLVKII
jgi:putative phage-type endonuclease